MSLPKIHVSTIDITIPSTKAKIKFTRFLVRDEKILLLAKESGDQRDILNAIKQVIINCCQDPTVDVNKLSITDLEYIFLKLHAASVSNVAKITVYDPEDDKRYPFDIDLNKVEVDDSKQKDANVKLSENLAVHLNYLPASLYGDKAMTESKDPVFDTVVHCMDKIYQGDTVFETKNETKEELAKWVSSLDYQSYGKIKEFYENAPSLFHEIKYQNSLGTERTYSLRSLSDFFTL